VDLTHPARALAPTLDVIIIEVLARTTSPLPLSQIHRLAGAGSLSGHLKALTRLVDNGLVLTEPGGYRLNREHVAAPAAEAIAVMRTTLLERIRDHVSTWRPSPVVVGIFGSLARREGDTHSDIDVLVVRHTASEHAADQAGELAEAIRRWSGNDTHVVDITSEDLARLADADEPILASWRSDLIPLLGALTIPKQPTNSPPEHRTEPSRTTGDGA
jgi:predicted nucleotidyltransferase